jgi:iron complex outermembrane receptor protein
MRAEWDVPVLSGLSVNARVIHSSSQYADAANMQKMPGWTRLDVGASYRMQTYPVTFRVNVENLLNKNYWESASGSGGRLRLAEPRYFTLSATIDF